MFSFGGEAAIGLSIGSSAIKLVELKRVRKSWKLVHFGSIQLPEDSIVNREIVNGVAVAEGLRTLVNQLRMQKKSICAGLAGNSVIIKRMMIDVPNARELQDTVFWEAEQYLPFDVSEVVMDYETLNRSETGQTDVLLVAVKKTFLDSYASIIEEAALKPKIMDVEFFALQNLFEASYPTSKNEAVCIVDIGAASLKMIVIHGGVPVFTKDSALGGKNLTQEIQKHLNLSFSDAEALKVGGRGGGTPQEVSDLMQIMAENFAAEIKRGIDFYNASSASAPVSFILLTGGASRIGDLSRIVQEGVGVGVQILNPFQAITYDPAVFTQDYVASIAAVAAVPLGLAIRMGST